MKAEYWMKRIRQIVNDDDYQSLELLAKMIEESEQAKQELRNKGYGWTGLSLLQTVLTEVPDQVK